MKMGKEKNVLYHASSKNLIGEKLIPKQADDLEKRKENLFNGVYATDIKEVAIAMGIISSKGVISGSLQNKKPYGTIYEGKPEQEFIYLYYLPKNQFKLTPPNKHQFVSEKPVKPIKIKKLKIEDYLVLIKYANPEETKNFLEKYNIKK